MEVSEAKAPGCFGAASVYSMDSAVCQSCVAFAACGEASLQTLQRIRETVDVRDILARHTAARQAAALKKRPAKPAPVDPSPLPVAQPAPIAKPVERKTPVARVEFPVSEEDQTVIAMLTNVKVREQALTLCKGNKINECRAKLPQGVNPFAQSGPSWLRVACDMLLKGGFTKGSLKQELIERLGWAEASAKPHVTIAAAIFLAFRIITVQDDLLVLHPALGADTV